MASKFNRNFDEKTAGFEDCTWKPRDLLYYLTLRSIIMYIREKVLYHPLVSIYTLRHLAAGHLATCPAARHRHFLVTFSSDL